MNVKRWFLGLLCVLVSVSAVGQVTLTRFAVHRAPHAWRFDFIFSNQFHYKSFSLKNPNRLVLDFNNVHLKTRFSPDAYVNTPVRAIRVGHNTPQTVRVVLDLRYPLKIKLQRKKIDNQEVLSVTLLGNKVKVLGFNWPFQKKNRPEVSNQMFSPALPTGRNVTIVIDPGHGGKDPGATGRRGTREKWVVLQLAKELKRLINHQKGYTAVITRKADYYIPLRKRLELARRYKADMFVSVHADAYKDRYANGASVFALSQRGATSEAARWLATRENASELMGGVDLSDKTNLLRSVLINLSQTATIRASLQIGNAMIDALRKITPLHHGRVEQAAFVVLKSPDIPSLLVESGFISNPKEELRLMRKKDRTEIAEAIMHGIKQYFTEHPPRDTWLAERKYQEIGKTVRYRVRVGDTLYGIAARYHVKVSQLEKRNQLRSRALRVGQILIIAS